ncbi:MAG: class I SAM-dependent methyltransferase [Deltaproteobacteria bacterium]|nr:class I SAM-dependent methyltransferase [Deltaproteobacteria bacterium]
MAGTRVTRGYGVLEHFLAEQRIKATNRLIPPESRRGRLLDIGCGTYPLFLTKTEFAERYGLDKVAECGATAGPFEGILLTRWDTGTDGIPFESGFFDVVTMLAVFEHIEPMLLPGILSEIHRVLKPGGRYILTTPARWADGLLRAMARLRLVSTAEIEEHKDAYTHEKLRVLLEEANFRREDLRFGHFEMFANLWAMAMKPNVPA